MTVAISRTHPCKRRRIVEGPRRKPFMTVDIATMCANMGAIVAACDVRMTVESEDGTYFYAAEVMAKMASISPDCRMMFAGTLSNVAPIVEGTKQRLYDSYGKVEHSIDNLVETAQQAYLAEWDQSVSDCITWKFRMTYDDYMGDVGRKQFSEGERVQLDKWIAEHDLDVELLVYGFTLKREPYIYTIDSPRHRTNHAAYGYAAIGSGGDYAEEILATSQVNMADIVPAIVHVCSAKFAAETDDDVGPGMLAFVLCPDDNEMILRQKELTALRDLWFNGDKPFTGTRLEEALALARSAYDNGKTASEIAAMYKGRQEALWDAIKAKRQ